MTRTCPKRDGALNSLAEYGLMLAIAVCSALRDCFLGIMMAKVFMDLIFHFMEKRERMKRSLMDSTQSKPRTDLQKEGVRTRLQVHVKLNISQRKPKVCS